MDPTRELYLTWHSADIDDHLPPLFPSIVIARKPNLNVLKKAVFVQ